MTFKRLGICVRVSVVLSARPGSFASLYKEACAAPLIGTLVKSDSMSFSLSYIL